MPRPRTWMSVLAVPRSMPTSADQSPNKEVSRFKSRGSRDSNSWVAADHTPRSGVTHRPTPYAVPLVPALQGRPGSPAVTLSYCLLIVARRDFFNRAHRYTGKRAPAQSEADAYVVQRFRSGSARAAPGDEREPSGLPLILPT